MKNTIHQITVHELNNCYEQNPNVYVIDVREYHEWQSINIPFALHIPKDELVQSIQNKIPDFNQSVYLYCQHGLRSQLAATWLASLGYTHVYSVEGGIVEWARAGYSVRR